jgi:hypothetical protein
VNGIWYFIEYKSYKELSDCDQVNRATLLRAIPKVSDTPVLILRKKQLSQKEMKAAKLKNDHPLAVMDEMNQR